MYEKKIEAAHPGLVVMILDDSGSMADALPGTTDAKFQWVERYTGIILKELLARSTVPVDDTTFRVKPRYYTAFVVYGARPVRWPVGATDVRDIETSVRDFAAADPTSGAANTLGLGGRLGGTDALAAFEMAHGIVEQALQGERFRDSFPPIVFHLSDGMSQSDAEPVAQRMATLETSDGGVLVVNALIGTTTSLAYTDPNDFPGYTTDQEAGPDPDSRRMFRMSSESPDTISDNLRSDGIFPSLRDGARLYFDVRTKEMLKHVIGTVGSGGSRANR